MNEYHDNQERSPQTETARSWPMVGALVARGQEWGASFTLLIAAICLGGLAALSLSLDADSREWFADWQPPGDIAKAINLSEAFAHGFGAAVILLSVWLVAVQRRPAVWMAVAMTVSSGLAANGLKAAFVRVRPHAVDQIIVQKSGESPPNQSATNDSRPSNREKVPLSFWDSRQRSFPSGHAATAGGLAIGLSLVFPRGTVLFAVLAGLACLQRVTSGAHYPSDVLAGLAIACICCSVIVWRFPKIQWSDE